jgi:hypothetical protein
VAVVAAPGAVKIMHSLEVLGDLAGVHAAPADSALVGERFSEDGIGTDGRTVVAGFGTWVAVPEPVIP